MMVLTPTQARRPKIQLLIESFFDVNVFSRKSREEDDTAS